MRLLMMLILLSPGILIFGADVTAKAVYSNLDAGWQQDFTEKREAIGKIAATLGLKLNGSVDDLAVLQRIIDSKVIKTTETARLQAIGVIFGDLVSKKVQVEWMLVTDEYGTDPVLKPKGYEVSIGALTMISKRIEKGEDFEVKDMYDWLTKLITEKYAVK